MAITFVSSGEQITTSSTTNPVTFTFDIGTRTNGGLIVCYQVQSTNAGTVSSATWAGTAMSKTAEISGTVAGGYEAEVTTGILYLPGPTNGSNTLSVTFSHTGGSSLTTALWPAWVDGFLQTSPLDDTDSGSGATDPTLTLQPTVNDTICFATYYSDTGVPLTSDQGTEYQNQDFGPRVGGAKYLIQTTAANQTLSWSGTDDNWLESAANFKPATGGAAVTVSRFGLLGVG